MKQTTIVFYAWSEPKKLTITYNKETFWVSSHSLLFPMKTRNMKCSVKRSAATQFLGHLITQYFNNNNSMNREEVLFNLGGSSFI